MLIKKAYVIRLKPTRKQMEKLEHDLNINRFIWNNALALQKDRFARGGSYLSFFSLCAELTEARNDPELSFLKSAACAPQQQLLKDLDQAFKAFFKKERGFPKFQSKKKSNRGLRYPKVKNNILIEDYKIRIPTIGFIKLKEKRDVEGTIKNVTLRKKCGHWYVSIQVELEIEDPVHPSTESVGIDLGVRKLAALSTGEFIPAIDFSKIDRKIKRAQKSLARKKKGSSNWMKQKEKLGKLMEKKANIRKDHLHKSTTMLTNRFRDIFIEDLKVKNMTASAKGTIEEPGTNVAAKSGLNRSILDQAFFEFRRQTGYKAEWKGGSVVPAPPHYTSQTCSRCEHVDKNNRKGESFRCLRCGFTEDADTNAAVNIRRRGLDIAADQRPEDCKEKLPQGQQLLFEEVC
ncbi:MAG: RNA-guided endonuclease InsQ/TnpB family protein [Planctomycetota bacterium]|jgi:putative transposase